MGMKFKVWILIGICLTIVLLISILPKHEWMNYLVIIFTGIIAYLLRVANIYYLRREAYNIKRPIASILKKILFGFFLGLSSMLLIVSIIFFAGGFSDGESFLSYTGEDMQQGGSSSILHFIETLLLYASSALAEETLFRSLGIGILMIPLSSLIIFAGEKVASSSHAYRSRSAMINYAGFLMVIITALLFGLTHRDSPGFGLISFINIALSGFIYGYLFLLSRDILSAWSMHFSWNLAQMLLGVPLSGKYVPSMSIVGDSISGARDSIIGGGIYGPEGSIVTLFVQLILVMILVTSSNHSIIKSINNPGYPLNAKVA